MKSVTPEGSRKRRLQKTSLLRARRSNKTSNQQQKMSVAARKQAASNKMQLTSGFHNSNFYAGEQLMISTKGNEALFVERKGKHYKTGNLLQPRRDEIISFDSAVVYGGTSRCACLACRRKCLEICQQQQQQRAEQIRMTNEAWIFRQQQMMKHQLQHSSTNGLLVSQNKHQVNHCEPVMKRARTAVQNFQLPSSLRTAVACDYNFHQQSVKFHPQNISAQANVKETGGQIIVNQNHNRLKNIHNWYFPNYQHPHLVAFDPFSALKRSHGSLTSSVGSDTSDIVTSQQLGNTCVTSQQLQMINDADFYNFVNC